MGKAGRSVIGVFCLCFNYFRPILSEMHCLACCRFRRFNCFRIGYCNGHRCGRLYFFSVNCEPDVEKSRKEQFFSFFCSQSRNGLLTIESVFFRIRRYFLSSHLYSIRKPGVGSVSHADRIICAIINQFGKLIGNAAVFADVCMNMFFKTAEKISFAVNACVRVYMSGLAADKFLFRKDAVTDYIAVVKFVSYRPNLVSGISFYYAYAIRCFYCFRDVFCNNSNMVS